MQTQTHHPALAPAATLSAYEAGVLARREGMIRQAPSYATPTDAREWARGYDDEQRRVNAAAQWARDHAANVDQWGFV